MLFNSIQFLIFFPIVVILWFQLPQKWRNIFLLLASYYFYMCWKTEYLVLILLSTGVDYFAALKIQKSARMKKKKALLYLSLLINLGLLFGFKYFNFFSESMESFFKHINIFYETPHFQVLLPVGISFYTFQTLSYTIDVYRSKTHAEKNFIDFALYVSFFPQLVAGPIERSYRLLPQIKKKHTFSRVRLYSGLRLMLWGFFQKVVIADRLAYYVNEVYNHSDLYHGWTIWVATFFFAFQIFCDFSGYTDIARGAARILGYDIMLNFRRPYFARSIRDFWQRWHISLSTWFRDYVYIPLGGNRVVRWRWYYNLLLTFVISGLWHGANWTFLFWGALHGLYLILSYAVKIKNPIRNTKKIRFLIRPVHIFFTFSCEYCLGFLPGRKHFTRLQLIGSSH
jgi:alginate O-acetyltransferase complex protein AlgI